MTDLIDLIFGPSSHTPTGRILRLVIVSAIVAIPFYAHLKDEIGDEHDSWGVKVASFLTIMFICFIFFCACIAGCDAGSALSRM